LLNVAINLFHFLTLVANKTGVKQPRFVASYLNYILGRKLEIPESLHTQFDAYLARCIEATEKAAEAISELDDLLETGFRGREVELVEKMINQLDEIEKDTDNMQIVLRKDLLALESELNPVDVIFLYQIFDWVGDLADLAERVGARLEILLARK